MSPQKFYLFSLFLFVIVLFQSANAQNFGKLRGFVTDSSNGEALAYGNIYIEELNTGASTDARGYYIINNIPAGKKLSVIFSYIGYKTQKDIFSVVTDKITQLNVSLVPERLELQAIEKIGEFIRTRSGVKQTENLSPTAA